VKRHFIFIADVQLVLSKNNTYRPQTKEKTPENVFYSAITGRSVCADLKTNWKHTVLQLMAFYLPKGHKLHAKRPPFAG